MTDNTAQLEEIAAKVIGGGVVIDAPTIALPPSGRVRLPGGYATDLDPGTAAYEAEVRELDGKAEEMIEKARQTGRADLFLDAIVRAGTVSIGGNPVTKAILDGLLIGDRDLLALEIRCATYGPTLDFPDLVCPFCNGKFELHINLREDVPIRKLEDSAQRVFDVKLRDGSTVAVRLPTRKNQDWVWSQTPSTGAESNSLLMSQCLLTRVVNGVEDVIVNDLGFVRHLPLLDRKNILREITDRQPGPQYNEVTFTHDACDKEVPFALSIGDLFPDL